ncbi:hypothetical protein AMELA_G00227570 [Ameiurus melas]|uniref:Uncharacterized protein n=1 Tax=Ameiurus melas TaxID=219545 RepID=A0A7J6A437_AMEME|nr:hypothetical protein AMELA_G00227570 [Ameiurus melas]
MTVKCSVESVKPVHVALVKLMKLCSRSSARVTPEHQVRRHAPHHLPPHPRSPHTRTRRLFITGQERARDARTLRTCSARAHRITDTRSRGHREVYYSLSA